MTGACREFDRAGSLQAAAARDLAKRYRDAFTATRVLPDESYREATLSLNTRKLMREVGLSFVADGPSGDGPSSSDSSSARGEEGRLWEGRVPFALPTFADGCTLLLVNGGSGPDVFLASLMAGPEGRVIVADPEEERLEKARSYVANRTLPGSRSLAPVEYLCAVGEALPLDAESVDSVVFNPFFNAAPDQASLIAEALRVLVAGGELYVASLFASRRLSPAVCEDEAAWSNFLGGALYIEDFRRLLARFGINCFRYMDQHAVCIDAVCGQANPAIADELRATRFTYRVIRTFKVYDFEDLCEKYGQVLTYKGNAPGCEQYIDINDTHRFFTWDPLGVCGNTAAFVEKTRLAKYFEIQGDRSKHVGTYDYCLYCGTEIGETGKLSNMARHLADLDLNRKEVDRRIGAQAAEPDWGACLDMPCTAGCAGCR